MLNRNVFIPVLVAALIGWVSVIGVNGDDTGKININTASAEQLMQLNGIGSHHAAKIIEFREKSGLFQNPEDLMRVSGIGQKIFEKNKALIDVEVEKPQRH